MLVEYRENKEWAWGRGERARVVSLDKKQGDRKGSKYQVLSTTPINKETGSLKKQGGRFWTTPYDVIYIPEGPADDKVLERIIREAQRGLSVNDYDKFNKMFRYDRTLSEAELLEFLWRCGKEGTL